MSARVVALAFLQPTGVVMKEDFRPLEFLFLLVSIFVFIAAMRMNHSWW